MPIPTNTQNIATLNAITATSNTQAWTFLPTRTAVQDQENPAFPRIWTITAQGVMLNRAGSSAGIMLEPLAIAMVQANPSLTWPPVLSEQPASVILPWSGSGSFTIEASDEITNFGLASDLTYQWQFSVEGAGGPWSNVSPTGVFSVASTGSTSTLAISNVAGLGGGAIPHEYMCWVVNRSGTTASNTAELQTDPTILAQPVNGTVAPLSSAYFSIAASGQSNLSYEWEVSNGGAFTAITSADVPNFGGWATPNYAAYATSNLAIASPNAPMSGYGYRCLVLDAAGTAISSTGTLYLT